MKNLKINNGIICLNDAKLFLKCADYPYYRDAVYNWQDRLSKLKDMGVNTITCYIPWRHHLIKSKEFDFTGKFKDNTNILLFLELCKNNNLFVIIKPGPFIHAEVNFGGLPDYLSSDDFEHMLDIDGNPILYEKKVGAYKLPSSFSSKYKEESLKWYSTVMKELYSCFYPNGNVIGIQLLNEGVFSDANSVPEKWDYSESALVAFEDYLVSKYNNIENINKSYNIEVKSIKEITCKRANIIQDIIKYDWCDFQYKHLVEMYYMYKNVCIKGIPLIANFNFPFNSNKGINAWLAKVQPEELDNITYGFTTWGGNVINKNKLFYTFLLVSKRYKGINMESNWGFSKLYEKEYEASIVPFYEVALSISNGSTGYNVYTGVSTSNWDENLDNIYERPYPDCSPIDYDGTLNKGKSKTIKLLNEYLERFGDEILDSNSKSEFACLINPTDFFNNCFVENEKNSAINFIYWFQHNMRKKSIDYAIVNITEYDKWVNKYKTLFISSIINLSEETQKYLIDYVNNGGRVLYFGELPDNKNSLLKQINKKCLNDNKNQINTYDFESGELFLDLPNSYVKKIGSGEVMYFGLDVKYTEEYYSEHFEKIMEYLNVKNNVVTDSFETQAWCLEHCCKDVKHVFVFSRTFDEKKHSVKIKYKGEYYLLNVFLPGHSAAIIRIEHNQVNSFLIKGENDLYKKSIKPELTYNDYVYKSPEYGDVLMANN